MTTTATVKVQFSNGTTQFLARDGTLYNVAADGTVVVNGNHVAGAIEAGALQIIINGPTSARPRNLGVGFEYFDTTLNSPIWHKGNNVWVNGIGTTV